MANVAYNIASVECELVTGLRRDTVESITEFRKSLSLSAGILVYIRDNLANRLLGTIPVDLRPDGLNLYYNVLLAEIQVCFYEAAKLNNMAPATQSKVAAGAGDLFRAATEKLTNQERWDAERTFPWHAHCESWAALFDAASFLRYSEVVLQQAVSSGTGYGTRCAWLQAAENACKVAINIPAQAEKNLLAISKGKKIATLPSTINTNSAKALLEELHTLRAEADRDNERIYRDLVPRITELPPLPRAILAAPLPFPDLRPEAVGMVDLFAGIVPAELATSLATVPDRLTQKANQYKERVNKATDEARGILQSLGLPGALEANTGSSSPGLPSNIADRVNRCQVEGGINELDRLWNIIIQNATASNDMIRQIEAVLNEEKDADQEMRTRIGDQRYSATRSEIVTAELRAELEKYRSLIMAASNSDQQLHARLDAYRPLLMILSRSRSEIDATIPSPPPVTGSNANAEPLISALRSNIKELDSLLDTRNTLIQKIKETYDKPAVMTLLKNTPNTEHTAVLDTYFSKTKSTYEIELDNNLNSQTRLLDQITVAFSRWNEIRSLDERSKARDRAIQNICESIDKFEEIRSNLREGENFWSDLKRSMVLLLQNCKDMLAARNMQRKELLLAIPPVVNTNTVPLDNNMNNNGINYPSLYNNTNNNNNYNNSGGGNYPMNNMNQPPSAPIFPSYPPTMNNNMYPTNSGSYSPSYNNSSAVPMINTNPMQSQQHPSWNMNINGNNTPGTPYSMYSAPTTPVSTNNFMNTNTNNNNNTVNPQITQLMAMGFTREQCEKALKMHSGDFDSALNQLLTE